MEQFGLSNDKPTSNTTPHKARGRRVVLIICALLFAVGAGTFMFIVLGGSDDVPRSVNEESSQSSDSKTGDSNTNSKSSESSEQATDAATANAESGTSWFGWIFRHRGRTNADSSTGQKNATQYFNVLANDRPSAGATFDLSTFRLRLPDTPVAGSTLSQSKLMVTAPGEGTYAAQPNGSIQYNPSLDFVGQAHGVGYEIEDTAGVTFSSLYTPTVVDDSLPPQVATCSDPASQELHLQTVRGSYSQNRVTSNMKRIKLDGERLSTDGQYTFGIDRNSLLYRSDDDGQTWRYISPNDDMAVVDIAVSASGSHVYAYLASQDDSDLILMRSTDLGETWVEVTAGNGYYAEVSDDGMTLVALSHDGNSNPILVRSTDGGESWNDITNIPVMTMESLAISADGQTIVVAGLDQFSSDYTIYRSVDGGANWTNLDPDQTGTIDTIYTSQISADGTTIVADGYNTTTQEIVVFVSEDAGASWTTPSSLAGIEFSEPQISHDGTRLIVDGYDTNTFSHALYSSDDMGITWTELVVPEDVTSVEYVTTSPDLSIIYITDDNNQTYVTSDSGVSWQTVKDSAQVFDPTRIDLDVTTPGRQLELDRSDSNGWIVSYDPVTDELTALVTDPLLFPHPQTVTLEYTLLPQVGCTQPVPGALILWWDEVS